MLSPPPGLSQSATSFIASCCQGIHQTPLSRLIRSRRRRALLCDGGSKPSNPSPSSGSEVFDPTAPPRQEAPRLRSSERPRVRPRPDRPHGQCHLDLERLSLVVLPLALLEDRDPQAARRRTSSVPHSDRTQKRLVFCSLHDVRSRLSRSCDQTGRLIRSSEPANRIDHAPAAGDWWVGEELNLRPHAYQACALTT